MFSVYVTNADSGDLWVYRLDSAGALSPAQRMMVGGQVMPLALSPDRRFLYAARRSDPMEVLSFGVDADNGELSLLGEAALPHSMAYLSTDRTGRWLFSASYGGDLVAVAGIGPDGVAGASRQVVPTGPNAHAILVDPANRFVHATSLGGGVLAQFRFDAERGELTPSTVFRPRPGASPRHLAFGDGARFIYLLSELDARVDAIAYESRDGGLRTVQTVDSLPPGFDGVPWASDLHLTPDGRRLFTCERRSSTLAMFDVDPVSGQLALVGHTPTENEPRGFALTPDGRFLIAAGQASHRLAVYAVEDRLRLVDTVDTGRNPNWVEVVALAG